MAFRLRRSLNSLVINVERNIEIGDEIIDSFGTRLYHVGSSLRRIEIIFIIGTDEYESVC